MPRTAATPAPAAESVDEYIERAPPAAQPHLKRLRALLRSVAPRAEETIKWGTPFYVEPRFLFAFSAYKRHASFAADDALEAFREELDARLTTKYTLKLPYDEPLPEDLLRRIAEHRLRTVQERTDESFW